jgi:hypothetical protein
MAVRVAFPMNPSSGLMLKAFEQLESIHRVTRG